MALVLKDRVLETSQTSGTGTISLAGAVNNFQSFSSAIGNGNTTYYAIVDDADSQWEVGIGTVGAGTLTRDTVYSSSNGGSLVNFNNSIKQVFCDYPASKGVYLDASGNVSSLGTITSGVWNGSTIPVANGGTGVTSSSGANSVVLRDANANITTNCLFEGFSTQTASGTTIVLTASSVQNWQITGSGGQTIRLPDATTLPNGATFTFNNNQSSGAIVVQNNSSTTVATINSGGYVTVVLLSNSIAAGSWDKHDSTPSNVSWSTNTLDYAGSITSATWNGNTVAVNRGGTGQSTYTDGQLLIGNSTGNTLTKSTLTAGTGISVTNSAGAITIANTSPSSGGTVTSVGGTGTVSGISLSGTVTSSGNLTLGGSLDLSSPPTIGNTAPNTGAFTTLNSTGGALNGTIGATTPAAITATIITGQTEVLKGTGQNLLTQSNTPTAGNWANTGVTLTSGQSDPFGGTAAWLANVTGSGNFNSGFTLIGGVTYTFSVYLKVGTYPSTVAIYCYAPNNLYDVFFNLSTGTVSSTAGTGVSNSITSVGNGWYKCTATATATASGTGYFEILYSGSTGTFYYYGGQVEIGTVANSTIITTTAPVYGTPTLSFSGVAGLGLQSDGSLYVSPAGTGALQAQATTSSTVGGNARGANAVDWQTSRASAGQVASGAYSVLGGGIQNTASGYGSFIGGGGINTGATGNYVAVAGGVSNTASGDKTFIGAGQSNTGAGYYNFIGGGFTNSGTASAAVTTQSGTMNATTAVTLSGSNANIKVGQYITGTSIAGNTYVAAISGTSLTLSQAASGSSTSTLSFYTPHGVVVGGGNNQATGSYSFIGGGGDAGTSANRNVASGDWSVVVGGRNNTASGIGSFVGGGGIFPSSITYPNSASGIASAVVGGLRNQATSEGSFVGGGDNNIANANYSSIAGGNLGTARSIKGNAVFPACQYPVSSSTIGASQAALLILGRQTTDATATVLTSDTSAASGTNQVILPNNSAYYFRGEVISGVTGGGDTKGWEISGVIKRGAGVGTTTLVGSTVTSLYADAGASTWTIALAADTTNGGLKVTFTGQASTTIRTVAQIRTTEMTY
jgi:hypothetical protein